MPLWGSLTHFKSGQWSPLGMQTPGSYKNDGLFCLWPICTGLPSPDSPPSPAREHSLGHPGSFHIHHSQAFWYPTLPHSFVWEFWELFSSIFGISHSASWLGGTGLHHHSQSGRSQTELAWSSTKKIIETLHFVWRFWHTLEDITTLRETRVFKDSCLM